MNTRIVFAAGVVLVLAASTLFLATRTIATPQHAIEKIIPNDRFFK